ncbi:MAG: glycogen synthase GlgA [Nitrospinae bacterium]|nr:glycogen synthase GlgA [Nitrospinota bacterium]
MGKKLKILLASSEVHPFAKTGGLADMAGSLPSALSGLGHDVRVIMPYYKCVSGGSHEIRPANAHVDVPVGPVRQRGWLFEGRLDGGLPVYLVNNQAYYYRDQLYGENGRDYRDNAERFIFFSRSILEACKALSFRPDIVHCHDWQTGLVPAYLKTVYAGDDFFRNTRSVFTVHNLGYQGNFPSFYLQAANLPWESFTPEGVEFYGHFSFLKTGLVFGDMLTTVSPSYGKEILDPEFGFGLDGVLRKRGKDLSGILNGADYREWDPARDPLIKKNYGPGSLAGKIACKKDLIRKFSLKVDEKAPIVSMVTRLSRQKGIDLVMEGADALLKAGAAFTLLGSGDPAYQDFFVELSKRHRDRCACLIGFDETSAHRIMAGSDILLVPSFYEPCGLTQIYGLKYGAVPLVRAVGGLRDTVQEFNPRTGQGAGFKFMPFESKQMLKAARKALAVYKDKDLWRRLLANGMSKDYSWDRSAARYCGLYLKALKKPARTGI